MFLRCYQRQIRPLPDGNGLILSTYSIQLPVTILSTQQVGLYLFSRYGQIIMTFLEAGKTDWVLRFQLLVKQPPTAKVIETFPLFKELDSTLMDQFFLNKKASYLHVYVSGLCNRLPVPYYSDSVHTQPITRSHRQNAWHVR